MEEVKRNLSYGFAPMQNMVSRLWRQTELYAHSLHKRRKNVYLVLGLPRLPRFSTA